MKLCMVVGGGAGVLLSVLSSALALAQDAPLEPLPEVEVPEFRVDVEATPGKQGQAAPAADVSLDALLGGSVYVVSKKPQLLRESPGVVTIVTREQLLDSGARDLIDVLQLVPGFFLGVDVQGVVGIGFRGNWGHEGKVLLLVDGQEMNELSYSTTQVGNHYPLEHVERIEIIRGPGSAVYGGFAELAVINIITRSAKKLRGISVAASYGQTGAAAGAFGRRTISLAGGDVWGDLSLSVAGLLGNGTRSDAEYVDGLGEAVDLQEDSRLDPRLLNVALAYRDLRLRFLYDGYVVSQRDAFGENLPRADRMGFPAWSAEVGYDLKLGDRVTLSPRLSYRDQKPWQVLDQTSDLYTDKSSTRALASLALSWDARHDLNVVSGVEAYQDHGFLNTPATKDIGLNSGFGPDSLDEVKYENVAAFAQAGLTHPFVNVTLGARYEIHSQFGDSFVPRLGLTRVIGRFHVKLLAARAFRAPGIENININADIQPERTTVFELESGYQLTDHTFLSANAYDMTIDDPIVYTSEVIDGVETEGYFNRAPTGTRGAELEYRMRYGWGYLNASGAVYTGRGKSETPDYDVPQDDDALLGAPLAKVAVQSAFNVYRGLVFSPSAILLTKRYREGDATMAAADPTTLLLNLFLRYPDLGVRGLEVGAGVYDLLGSNYRFVQPYLGGHPPLPGPTREVVVRVAYTKEL